MLLQSKVAIITGAASGIGQTGARLFAREGASVVIADINNKNGEQTAKGIRQQGKIHYNNHRIERRDRVPMYDIKEICRSNNNR